MIERALNIRGFVWWCFFACLLFSTLIVVFVGYDRGVGTDGAFYALSGYNLFHGRGFTYSDVPNTFTWPLISILIGLFSLILDDLQLCIHIVLTLSFALTVFPLHAAARLLFDRKTAHLATLLYVSNGFLLRMSARMSTESLLILWLVASLYFTARAIQSLKENQPQSLWVGAGLGVSLGLAYLTKPEAAIYLISALLGWFAIDFRKSIFSRKAIFSGVVVATFVVVILPQILFIHDVTGKWQLVTYNRFVFRGYVEPFVSVSPGEPAVDEHVEYNYNAYIVRGPYTHDQLERDLRRLWPHVQRFFDSMFNIVGPVHFLLLGLAFFFLYPRSSLALCSLFLLPTLFTFFWYSIHPKYFIAALPFLSLTSAATLLAILPANDVHRWKLIAWLFVFTALIIWSFIPMSKAPANSTLANHRDLGIWARNNLPDIEGSLLADRKPYVSFMTKARFFRYNAIADDATLIKLLKKHHVKYLVVDDFYTRTKNPGVSDLLSARSTPDLEFLHMTSDSVYGRALLFRVIQ